MQAEPFVQIVGAACAHCDRRIVSLMDGASCPTCSTAVHVEDECWRRHWEAKHAGASSYRDGGGAPPPPEHVVPVDRSERGSGRFPHGVDGERLCTACYRRVDAPLSMSFLGFPRFNCPRCGSQALLPLSTGRKVIYYAIIALCGFVMIAFLIQGTVAFPGFFAIAAIIALLKNRGVVEKLAMAEVAAPAAGDRAEGAPRKKKTKKKKKDVADSAA